MWLMWLKCGSAKYVGGMDITSPGYAGSCSWKLSPEGYMAHQAGDAWGLCSCWWSGCLSSLVPTALQCGEEMVLGSFR